MPVYAGLEMGGTKTIAVLGEPGAIRERVEFPTKSPEVTLARAADIIAGWHEQEPILALGVASFGPVRLSPQSPDYGTILDTPKPGWRGTSVLGALKAGFAGPMAIDTDVNAAALAEFELGAGRNADALVYITIGTGVGGGVLIDGKALHGQLHPEIGHMRLRRDPTDSFAGVCPYHGACIEGLISGPAIHARFGIPPGDVRPDDPRWVPVASDLAELLANLLLALSPDKIVVGGGVTMRQPHLLRSAIARLPERLGGYLGTVDAAALQTRIVLPQLGDDAGPNGSLCLARSCTERAIRSGDNSHRSPGPPSR